MTRLLLISILLWWGLGLPVAAAGPPDQIAFVSPRAGDLQISAVSADGSGLRQLTRPPGQSLFHPGLVPGRTMDRLRPIMG